MCTCIYECIFVHICICICNSIRIHSDNKNGGIRDINDDSFVCVCSRVSGDSLCGGSLPPLDVVDSIDHDLDEPRGEEEAEGTSEEERGGERVTEDMEVEMEEETGEEEDMEEEDVG